MHNSFVPRWIAALGIFVMTINHSHADGELDPSFQAGVLGSISQGVNVSAIAEQNDGKVLVGGSFDVLGTSHQANFARLNTEGSVDTGFSPVINSSVRAILIQTDNKIVIGGSFNRVNGEVRNAIARLNANGTLDTSFTASIPGGVTVTSMALQANGQILVAGNFRFADGENGLVARGRIARFNANGTLDTTYNPNANDAVEVITLDGDGKALVGGLFTNIASTSRSRIARINTDGTLDTTFNPNANQRVDSIAVQEDGKVLLGGRFTAIGTTPTTRNSLARVNTDGSLDTDFNPNVNSEVSAITIDAAGNIFIGGQFSTVGGVGSSLIAKLSAAGVLDTNFSPNAGIPIIDNVDVILIDSNGKLLTGGDFVTIAGTDQSGLVRLNSNGTVDNTFNAPRPLTTSILEIKDIALQADGNILIAGEFTFVGTDRREGIALLTPDGSNDLSFINAAVRGGRVDSVVIQNDGKLIIVGGFNEVSGESRDGIARLNPDGSLDSAFAPRANGRVTEAVLQDDGKLLIGGSFTDVSGTPRNRVARLNTDGTLDMAFDPDVSSSVDAIHIQADGKILIGGSFSEIGTIMRDRIARVNQDGSVDTSFIGVDLSTSVNAILQQVDGKILIGGEFNSIAGMPMGRHARLNADGTLDTSYQTDITGDVDVIVEQPDGQILIGGDFNDVDDERRARLARLNADGSLDTDFIDPLLNGRVNDIILLANGNILVAGSFITVDGVPRNRIARLINSVDSPLCTAIKAQNNNVAVICL